MRQQSNPSQLTVLRRDLVSDAGDSEGGPGAGGGIPQLDGVMDDGDDDDDEEAEQQQEEAEQAAGTEDFEDYGSDDPDGATVAYTPASANSSVQHGAVGRATKLSSRLTMELGIGQPTTAVSYVSCLPRVCVEVI